VERNRAVTATERWIIDGWGPRPSIEERMKLSDTLLFVDLPLWMHFWLAAERQISVAELRDVVVFALLTNAPSIAVMERLRFVPQVEFDRPAGRHRLYRKALIRVPRYT
jgi:hypothetical protein